MKSNVKLNKLFNLNNMFTLLLIVILILVIVCCVRKNKSNKENFLDWSPLTCNEKGETDWESKQHFGDVRCLDGQYGSAGASNDPRAKALGGFLEFTADGDQGELKDFVNRTEQVMTELESLSAFLYETLTISLRIYGNKDDGNLKTQKQSILEKYYLLTGIGSEDGTSDPLGMSTSDSNKHKNESLIELRKKIKDNLLDKTSKDKFNSLNNYFDGIDFMDYKQNGRTITKEIQKRRLTDKYNWRKNVSRKEPDTLLISGNKDDDNAEWDEKSAVIAFENELGITFIKEKQLIDNANSYRPTTN